MLSLDFADRVVITILITLALMSVREAYFLTLLWMGNRDDRADSN